MPSKKKQGVVKMTTEFLEHYYALEHQYPTIEAIPEAKLKVLRKKYSHQQHRSNFLEVVDRRPVKRAEELQKYWNQGLSSGDIATQMKLSRSTIVNYLRRMGLVDHKRYLIKITRGGIVHYALNVRNAVNIAGYWSNGSTERSLHWLKKQGWAVEYGKWNENDEVE